MTSLPVTELSGPTASAIAEPAIMSSGKLDVWIGDRKSVVSEGDSFRMRNGSLRMGEPLQLTGRGGLDHFASGMLKGIRQSCRAQSSRNNRHCPAELAGAEARIEP